MILAAENPATLIYGNPRNEQVHILAGNPVTGRSSERRDQLARFPASPGRSYVLALAHISRHTRAKPTPASLGLSLFIVRAIPSGASGNTERGLPVTRPNASAASLIQGAHPSEASFSSHRPTGYTRPLREHPSTTEVDE